MGQSITVVRRPKRHFWIHCTRERADCLARHPMRRRRHGAPSPDEIARSSARIEADVRFLADDLLEGREAGTRGFDLAALYVAAQYRLIGLEPGGRRRHVLPARAAWCAACASARARASPSPATDARRSSPSRPSSCRSINFTAGAAAVTAPMVFVGQAVHAPELQHDDFAGVEVRGKIAVALNNAPARFPVDQRAFHASTTEKLRELERRGAVGVIFLGDPENEARRPWALDSPNWRRPAMRRIDAQGRPADDFPGLPVRVSASVHAAEAIFAGSPHTAAEVFAHAREGRAARLRPRGRGDARDTGALDRIESRNVIGAAAR